jgi:DNA-directed RNA polymerase sigma subunit (sigma70/sigma32)
VVSYLSENDVFPERNVGLFKLFYGLDGSFTHRTLEQVGQKYEITRERVRQIVAAMWDKLSLLELDMDHDGLLADLRRIRELEKLVGEPAKL